MLSVKIRLTFTNPMANQPGQPATIQSTRVVDVMNKPESRRDHRQSAARNGPGHEPILLLVVTMLAVSMFRSMGLDEKIAGNMRDKQRALNAAEPRSSTRSWLSLGFGSNGVACNSVVTAAVGQVCSNTLQSSVPNNDVTVLPWKIGSTPVGMTYLPRSRRR